MKFHWLIKPFSTRSHRSPNFMNGAEIGMTIIEILIVIALIGTIMTVIMTNVLDKNDQAKIDLTSVQEKKIAENLDLYKVHMGRYPTTEQGLRALLEAPDRRDKWRGPYTEMEKLSDPWSQAFKYESPTANTYEITSAGPDGEFASGDDIKYPAQKFDDVLPKSFELDVGKPEQRSKEDLEKIQSGEQ
jgi:general secretion pathway protein G